MPTEIIMQSLFIILMQSLFIILMGYFTIPFNIRMYLLSFFGALVIIIVDLIISTDSALQTMSSSINEPVWVWVIVLIYFAVLFVFGRWLASMDKWVELG